MKGGAARAAPQESKARATLYGSLPRPAHRFPSKRRSGRRLLEDFRYRRATWQTFAGGRSSQEGTVRFGRRHVLPPEALGAYGFVAAREAGGTPQADSFRRGIQAKIARFGAVRRSAGC